MKWSVVYKKAYNEDGSLFFPEKLSQSFLDDARKTMGSYLFANQYLNEVFPSDEQTFKPHWIQVYPSLPLGTYTFAFIDPAISTKDGADYTALTVVDVDYDKNWYVRVAKRERLTPTQIVSLCFDVYHEFKPKVIGIETVAYQEALLYMIEEESRKRREHLPVTGIKTGTDKTKEMRIMGLVPRFEWNRIFLAPCLYDLQQEMMQFPRGSHDDLLDSLSQQETIIYYPTVAVERNAQYSPHDMRYEKQIINNLVERANDRLQGDE